MTVQPFRPNGSSNKRLVRGKWVNWTPDPHWAPMGISPDSYPEADSQGVRVLHLGMGGKKAPRQPKAPKDRSAAWLRYAMIALALLAIATAIVSYEAQYLFVYSLKHTSFIAHIQAGLPDIGAAVFAALAIAQALKGKRAIRARFLNLDCVALSVGMNLLAAVAGYKGMAVWIVPPIMYALASDTLIGVIRSLAIAKQKEFDQELRDDEATPWAVIGALMLWNLRLILDPRGTVSGFRQWTLREINVAPHTKAVIPVKPSQVIPPKKERKAIPPPPTNKNPRKPSAGTRGAKTAAFWALVEEDYPGGLSTIPRNEIGALCKKVCPKVDMHPGSGRKAIYRQLRRMQLDEVKS